MTRIPSCPPATTRELQNFVTSRQARAPDAGPDIFSTWILPRPPKRPSSQVRYEQRRKKRRHARENGLAEEPKDEDLFVMTINVMHSSLRVRRLVQDQLGAVHPADVIALQDVPQSLPSLRLSGYELAYRSDRVLEKGEDGQPLLDDKGRPKEIMQLRYVAFLVRSSIPLANWRASWDEGANKGLLATAIVETDHGPRTILNLYNHLERADFGEIPFENCDIFCGDINAHHPLWGGEETIPNSSGNKARLRMDAAEMINVGPRGVPTYYGSWANTTIDVIWLAKSAHSFFKRSEVLEHRDFHSDHRPLLVVLHGGPHRDDSIRYLWRKVSKQTLAHTIPRYLKLLGNPPLNTQADIDRHIARFLRLVSAAIADCVPTVKRNPFRPVTVTRTVTSAMRRDMALERKAARSLSRLRPGDRGYKKTVRRTFKENCEILEMYHEQVMEWATPNGIRFDPGKYKVMHFNRNEKCDLCPKISGLTVKHVINNSVDPEAPKHLRILGVMVDPALKWDAHIANLESKVKKKLGFLKRISSSVMGPNLIDMRRLYITSVRPIITYACACWFVLADGKGQQFRITKKLIARLDRLQRECLVEISGAYNQTPVMVLQKELNIEPIEVALHRIATAHRVRNTNTLEGERTLKVARRPFHRMRSFACFDVHPYWVAYQQAGLVRDETVQYYGLERSVRLGRNVSGWFNQYLREQGVLRSAYLWAEFAEKHALKAPRTCGYEAVTYMGEWCTNIMSIHMGKTRAQSTILLHMRTGHNGLNANLFSINRADTNMCPCGEGEHTVEHLLFDCVSLARQRRELLLADYGICDDDLRRLRLRYLLTQCAGPVSAWALENFELEQFSWTKEHLPIRTRAFPFSSGTRHRRV
ncbi:hypothetical protein K456DRAFT_1945665 [Colletotrichum gloeosporioides 23]|nr:hypothetical protein K456DRAFT_1945665 [Colletotrichum gloeosporioides 23]